MIVYLISNVQGINTGRGGHYYSLKQMANAVSEYEETIIITVGTKQSPVFDNVKNSYFVPYDLINNKKTIDNIINLLTEIGSVNRITAVHAYDFISLYVGLTIAKKVSANFVHTKCGGATPKSFYPIFNKLILFHEADRAYFEKHCTEENNIYVIPNRVNSVLYNTLRSEQVATIRDNDKFNIIKIGRIGKSYYKTLKSSINLAAGLQDLGLPVQLIFVGYLESRAVLDSLQRLAEEKKVTLNVYTGKIYTNQASELLWAADAVVGNGRGAMEALSLGKVLFFSAKDSDNPYLFTQETAFYAAYENFSERVVLPYELKKFSNISFIYNEITKHGQFEQIRKHNKEFFDENYCVSSGAKKVINLYHEGYSLSHQISPLTIVRVKLKLAAIKIKIFIKSVKH